MNEIDFIGTIIEVLKTLNLHYTVVVVLASSWLLKVIEKETSVQKQLIVFGTAAVLGAIYHFSGWIDWKDLLLSFFVTIGLYEVFFKQIMRASGNKDE